MTPETPTAVYSVESYPLGKIKKHTKLKADDETGRLIIDLGGISISLKPYGDKYGSYESGPVWTFYFLTHATAVEAAIAKCRHEIKQARATIKGSERAIIKLQAMKEATQP